MIQHSLRFCGLVVDRMDLFMHACATLIYELFHEYFIILVSPVKIGDTFFLSTDNQSKRVFSHSIYICYSYNFDLHRTLFLCVYLPGCREQTFFKTLIWWVLSSGQAKEHHKYLFVLTDATKRWKLLSDKLLKQLVEMVSQWDPNRKYDPSQSPPNSVTLLLENCRRNCPLGKSAASEHTE